MSPRTTNASYIESKNQLHSHPLWLYRISVDGVEANDLFLAETDYDVYYYRTDADGVDYAQVYTGFSLKHDGLDENSQGEITGPTVTIGMVNRDIMYYIQNSNGLKGRKVTIRQVMFDSLSDKDAYIQDIYYVDGVNWNDLAASFELVSRLEAFDVEIPTRPYGRSFCRHVYKDQGCWVSDGAGGYNKPADFKATMTPLFLDDNTGETDDSLAYVKARFHPIDCTGLDITGTDYIQMDLKVSDPTKLTYTGSIHFASALGRADADIAEFWYAAVPAGLTTAWQTFTIAGADWTEFGSTPDLTKIDYVAAFDTVTGDCAFSIRNIFIYRTTPYNVSFAALDSCSKTLKDCIRHGNRARFGAQPGIPRRRATYGGAY